MRINHKNVCVLITIGFLGTVVIGLGYASDFLDYFWPHACYDPAQGGVTSNNNRYGERLLEPGDFDPSSIKESRMPSARIFGQPVMGSIHGLVPTPHGIEDPLVFQKDLVYVVDEDSVLHVLDAQGLEEVFRYDLLQDIPDVRTNVPRGSNMSSVAYIEETPDIGGGPSGAPKPQRGYAIVMDTQGFIWGVRVRPLTEQEILKGEDPNGLRFNATYIDVGMAYNLPNTNPDPANPTWSGSVIGSPVYHSMNIGEGYVFFGGHNTQVDGDALYSFGVLPGVFDSENFVDGITNTTCIAIDSNQDGYSALLSSPVIVDNNGTLEVYVTAGARFHHPLARIKRFQYTKQTGNLVFFDASPPFEWDYAFDPSRDLDRFHQPSLTSPVYKDYADSDLIFPPFIFVTSKYAIRGYNAFNMMDRVNLFPPEHFLITGPNTPIQDQQLQFYSQPSCFQVRLQQAGDPEAVRRNCILSTLYNPQIEKWKLFVVQLQAGANPLRHVEVNNGHPSVKLLSSDLYGQSRSQPICHINTDINDPDWSQAVAWVADNDCIQSFSLIDPDTGYWFTHNITPNNPVITNVLSSDNISSTSHRIAPTQGFGMYRAMYIAGERGPILEAGEEENQGSVALVDPAAWITINGTIKEDTNFDGVGDKPLSNVFVVCHFNFADVQNRNLGRIAITNSKGEYTITGIPPTRGPRTTEPLDHCTLTLYSTINEGIREFQYGFRHVHYRIDGEHLGLPEPYPSPIGVEIHHPDRDYQADFIFHEFENYEFTQLPPVQPDFWPSAGHDIKQTKRSNTNALTPLSVNGEGYVMTSYTDPDTGYDHFMEGITTQDGTRVYITEGNGDVHGVISSTMAALNHWPISGQTVAETAGFTGYDSQTSILTCLSAPALDVTEQYLFYILHHIHDNAQVNDFYLCRIPLNVPQHSPLFPAEVLCDLIGSGKNISSPLTDHGNRIWITATKNGTPTLSCYDMSLTQLAETPIHSTGGLPSTVAIQDDLIFCLYCSNHDNQEHLACFRVFEVMGETYLEKRSDSGMLSLNCSFTHPVVDSHRGKNYVYVNSPGSWDETEPGGLFSFEFNAHGNLSQKWNYRPIEDPFLCAQGLFTTFPNYSPVVGINGTVYVPVIDQLGAGYIIGLDPVREEGYEIEWPPKDPMNPGNFIYNKIESLYSTPSSPIMTRNGSILYFGAYNEKHGLLTLKTNIWSATSGQDAVSVLDETPFGGFYPNENFFFTADGSDLGKVRIYIPTQKRFFTGISYRSKLIQLSTANDFTWPFDF